MTLWALAGFVLIALVGYVLLSGFFTNYRRYRGTRVITCPENLQPASVKVDALKAAHWAAISGDPLLRLNSCSRWPGKAGCGQECLSQVRESPEACAVRTIVSQWYAGKSCFFCAKEIGPIVWHERPPAVLSAQGDVREWKDIPAEQLPEVFRTHEPVCFNCSLTEAFRHDHPDMIVSRNYPKPPSSTIAPSNATY